MRSGAWVLIAALVAGATWVFVRDPLRVERGPSAAARAQSAGEIEAGWKALEAKRAKLEQRGPKSMNKPAEAAEFFVAQRLAPGTDRLPIDHLQQQARELRRREARVAASPGGVTTWTWLGPGNVGGRTRALVIDPNTPDTMYAAGVAGGIWKSYDAGASWEVADDLMLNLAVCSLAIDPQNTNVLYAGTGEGYFLSGVFVQGLGIFKSTDAGASWTQLLGTVTGVPPGAFDYVNKVVVSPSDSSRVYAGTRTGVWRSLDGGQSWAPVLSNPFYLATGPFTRGCTVGCTDLQIRTDRNPDTLYAAFGSLQDDGLYRTFDGGDSWQQYTVPTNQGRTTIAFAPSDQDVMYLLMADNGSGGALGQLLSVFRSDDGGNNFTSQVDFTSLAGPWLLSNLILATGCIPGGTYAQGWYDNIIAVDPVDPDVVWVGGVDIFRSDDGGVNFEIPGYWIFYQSSPLPPYQIHPDHHTIAFHPDYDGVANQTMYVGNDGGLYRTRNARAATSLEDCPLPADEPLPEIVWESVNNGYGVTQFYHGDSARDADVFIGGCQDNGTNRVRSKTGTNSWDLIFGGDGGYVAIDPTDSQVVYVEYQDFPSFQKSTDGGDTFVPAITGFTDSDGIFIAPFAMDPSDPDVLWAGGTRPWRTTNGADLWELAGGDFPFADQISAIGIAPSDGNVVYMGFTNGYVARSTDALAPSPSWTVFGTGLPLGSWVSCVTVDPRDPDVAYATYSSYGVPHVLRTTNGGQSWSSIDGIGFTGVPDIPVHWLAVRPCDSDQLYAATELGVFASDDRGATWQPVNDGLANTVVESLDFQNDNTLVAFTHGRGAYLVNLVPCPRTDPFRDLRPQIVPR